MSDAPDYPDDHPLAPFADDLETHPDRLDALGKALYHADADAVHGAVVTLAGTAGTDVMPTINPETSNQNATLWLLGAHLRHAATVASRSSGVEVSMREVAEDAIALMDAHDGTESVLE